ncbi:MULTISPECIES: hypothetical protein [Streptococcus]|uniref:hypothetical protein n=1 Tax=Streptococcus TaxID=1301 RepID=UPI000264318D|nr:MULTISPECIES: hypothetical protein [Streptococcus]EPW85436.1 hypothetical protein SAG0124_09695 [Streptococcus agalactiae STIR-CD-14]AKT96215.1 hypothetical protein SAHN016_05765 [Streptococcus agalactiae]AKT98163.1 hypothetical protein YM001_05705 [Streptococcus agalactiae]AKU00090.1 hypothetical protein GX064_05680 [Streptococcus agalactiae]ALB16092.1 hypothetical protein AMD29_05795 [Streptococcus agalactiae]
MMQDLLIGIITQALQDHLKISLTSILKKIQLNFWVINHKQLVIQTNNLLAKILTLNTTIAI